MRHTTKMSSGEYKGHSTYHHAGESFNDGRLSMCHVPDGAHIDGSLTAAINEFETKPKVTDCNKRKSGHAQQPRRDAGVKGMNDAGHVCFPVSRPVTISLRSLVACREHSSNAFREFESLRPT